MKEFDASRRKFLKFSGRVTAGIITGEVLYPVGIRINKTVENLSGQPSGNAQALRNIRKLEQLCQAEEKPIKCIDDTIERSKNDPDIKFSTTVLSPIIEETLFRAGPSLLLDKFERDQALRGKYKIEQKKKIGLNRRELTVGAVTSLLFGGGHNFTSEGFDTEVIPASQTLIGMGLWYLQRKFGFVSCTLAHALHNRK
jgi:hypothetical protein